MPHDPPPENPVTVRRVPPRWVVGLLTVAAVVLLTIPMTTCRTTTSTTRVGEINPRRGDEIMIAGQLVHTGAPVVLWFDPGGYDAYRVERRFAPREESGWADIAETGASPNRYGIRADTLDDPTLERVRGGGWTLKDVQDTVDQFVLHYDVSGTSRQCFKILHDMRGLSVHFLLDIDGTIYQTLDVKERAWHATKANNRSVGIEIAQIGAYPSIADSPLETWYTPDAAGPRITLPEWLGDGGVRTPGFVARPARPEPIAGEINGRELVQYDFTPEQYDSLVKLTAALCSVLPNLECDYPRGPDGGVLERVMSPEEFDRHRGLIGHWHIQDNKIDPGPAMDWERVVRGARRLMDE